MPPPLHNYPQVVPHATTMMNRLTLMSHRFWHRGWFYPLISLVVALGLGVGSSLPASAFDWGDLIGPGIQVIQLSNMSDRQEMELGKQIDEQVKGEFQMYRDSEITAYVEDMGKRLVAQSSRPKLPFTFQVVNDDAINAFATAGGFVYVNTGLLKAADTEAEVAGVIGHEIGHITNKHVLKQIRQSVIAGGLADAAGLDRNTVVNLGFEFGFRRPRSRQHEFEADSTGLDMVVRSGYAPSGMISFFQKLLGQGSVPTLLSTHPATEDRITRLQQEINQKYPSSANSVQGMDRAAYRQKIRKLL